ncbi:hypothetical protein D9758_014839 [Tetrapyrgos nigripes]|uniref:Uncharacterized protein n=1 Tax=Tetrapyrgos nigripes TaxID=182062 RepID=A0A8H5CV59_9AGAR|nr:hypothetical protein D9758_014839 [Tetrapyrgos nigripes]
MANLARLSHTTLFFRSISPGHPICPQYRQPFSSIHGARNWSLQAGHDNPEPEEWDWDMFPRNEKWREAIRNYEREENDATACGMAGGA